MKRCTRCLLPETKPGIKFDSNGLCTACQHKDLKKTTDYKTRQAFLGNICDEYRSKSGGYDCIIAVSGGKDSTYQTYIMKRIYHMNPLLVCVTDDFQHTHAGEHNLNNLSETFNCDTMILHLASNFNRRMTRWGFENIGSTNWAVDKAIYSWPLKIAIQMGIPLVVYGEDTTWEYGGVIESETYSAKHQISNDIVKEIPIDRLIAAGFKHEELNQIQYPSKFDIDKVDPIFLSYFYPWDWVEELNIAKQNGFVTLEDEWNRDGYVDDYIQLDSIGYLFNYCVKYRKLGWSQATHVVSHLIRWEHLSKEKGIELLRKTEGFIDPIILHDFIRFTGYQKQHCLDILDSWTNTNILENVNGRFIPKKGDILNP